MKQKIITRPVPVWGRDPWGRKASMTFGPLPQGMLGQYMIGKNKELVPFCINDARVCWPHNIGVFPKHAPRKKVVEHMLVLPQLGYNFAFESSGTWLPHMRTEKILEQLAPFTKELDSEVGYFSLIESTTVEKRNGWMQRKNTIMPHPEGRGVFVDVMVHYPLLGDPFRIYGELTEDMIMESCRAKFSGYPFNQYGISKIFNPHHHELGWREIVGDAEALRILAYHRLNDLLGALAFIPGAPGLLPACVIKSHMGNHALDLALVRKLVNGEDGGLTQIADEQLALSRLLFCC